MLGLDGRNAGRIEAAHLAGAHAHRHAVLAKHDGVALDELGHVPGKQHVLQLLFGGLQLGDHPQIG